jgi:probable F420-dependent oxidoreductase
MKIGIVVRNMGPQSSRDTLVACARAVDAAPRIADLWVVDHVAIPPDDAEGSNGRYLDPLATLAFLAGVTSRTGLGTAILVLPYRPALPTAKWVATIQELSQGRLLLGVGVGWMEPEFRALGVDRRQRGALSDQTLDLLDRCFADDVVEQNGQRFLFRPRPERPPLFIGGSPPHAFRRAIAHRAGWLPVGLDPEKLRAQIAALHGEAARAGVAPPPVTAMTSLPLDDVARATEVLRRHAEAGASRVIHGARYADADEFRARLDRLVEAAEALPGDR